MELVEKALELMLKLHKGQKDLSGAAYVLHPLRVGIGFKDPRLMAAAFLHDTIEDVPHAEEILIREGIPEDVLRLVRLLSKGEHEDYMEYIQRLSKDRDAIQIKKKDLEDNMREDRMRLSCEKDRLRMIKYKKAYAYLEACEREGR